MYVNSNVGSLISRTNLSKANDNLSNTMNRLASGKRINSASDDAAGLAIATRMSSQVRGMETAIRNANDGVSMIQTAESALGGISDILQRMRELSVQADNGTYSDSDKTSIKSEMDDLISEIDHIADTTTFNGVNLTNAAVTKKLHISDKADDTIDITFASVKAADLGTTSKIADVNVTEDGGAQAAITAIDEALDQISTSRAGLGSKVNRLNFTISNLESARNNTTASRSRIEDADMAAEASELIKQRILSQSSMAMLGQSNAQPQAVLSLLQV